MTRRGVLVWFGAVVLTLGSAVACVDNSPDGKNIGGVVIGYGQVRRYLDDSLGVACYTLPVYGGRAISCVKVR